MSRLNEYPDSETLLLIGGIESNPGPPLQHTNIAHVNINSITAENRRDELLQFLDINDIQICALTETKLDNNVPPSMYTLAGFNPPLTRHRNRHGGGVALYSHASLPVKRLPDLELGEEEWIWAKIKLTNMTLLICCIYLPPNLDSERLQNFIEHFTESLSLSQRYMPATILLLGDFNTGNVYLSNETAYSHSGITTFDHKLNDTATMLELTQLISQPTRISENKSNLRDLIFINNTQVVEESGTLSSFTNIDHFPVYVSIKKSSTLHKNKDTGMTVWDYSKLDPDLLTRLLQDTDWEDILNNDIDEATDKFIDALLSAAKASIPQKTVRHRHDQKPWMSATLTRNIRKRDRLFKQARNLQTEHAWERWKYQRNFVTSLNRQMKKQYIEDKVSMLISQRRDPRKYHQTLRTLTGRTRNDNIPPLERPDGEILTDDCAKATLLNNYFAEQAKHDTDTQLPILRDEQDKMPVPTLGEIKTSEREVLQCLNSLDANKATGPDEIPAKLLKLTAVLIAEPLSKLYNKSLGLGIYPSKFKEANVKPIFKNKGSPSEVSNYRPISLLSSLSKVFEKIVHKHIHDHFSQNSLLTEKQSGYRRGHSAEQQLLYFTHNLYRSLDSGQDFTAIYLDISKYFDKIWHTGLLHKCRHDFGITDSLYDWLKSYLTDRRQRVRIDDTFSDTKIINAGCPQGSVLGPLLALIYLDGLSTRTHNDILFFADDVSIYASYPTEDFIQAQTSLQKDLDAIYKYGQEWAITFNTNKTKQQTFSLKQKFTLPTLAFGNDKIPHCDNHTHLGMTFSKDLRFHQHVNEICKKVQKTLSPLYPIAPYIPRDILDEVYKTYVRPHFDLYDTIYDGHLTAQDTYRLETLQNRAGRLVTGTLFRTSTDKLLHDLGWNKLTVRRKIHKLSLYHTFTYSQHTPAYIKSIMPATRTNSTGRTLRNANNHTIMANRTTSYQSSYFLSTCKLWNELPETIRSLPHTPFKRAIAERLGVSKPPNYYKIGSKEGNVLHTRLRTEMSLLNSHQFQINKCSTTACSCGYPRENVRHFTLFCRKYEQQRNELFRDTLHILGINDQLFDPNLTLRLFIHGETLGGEDERRVAHHFQKFLINSNRFSKH